MKNATGRLDSFTDAAFAFALSLLVIGGSEIPTSYDQLASAMANVPIFAIGFAIIGSFWYGHVRWRDYRGDGGVLSVVLTFTLVFLVLVYVPPLQAMSASFATFLGGSGTRFTGGIAGMFAIYGAGFMALSALLALLFWDADRHAATPDLHAPIRGEIAVWSIMAATGLVSVLMTMSPSTAQFSPFVYATLPISIGLCTWLWNWDGTKTP